MECLSQEVDLGGAAGLQTVVDRPRITARVGDKRADLQVLQRRTTHATDPAS
jgi:hypothetical protein